MWKEYKASPKHKKANNTWLVIMIIIAVLYYFIFNEFSVSNIFVFIFVVIILLLSLNSKSNPLLLSEEVITEQGAKRKTDIKFKDMAYLHIEGSAKIRLVDKNKKVITLTNKYEDFEEIKLFVFKQVKAHKIKVEGDKQHFREYMYEHEMQLKLKDREKKNKSQDNDQTS